MFSGVVHSSVANKTDSLNSTDTEAVPHDDGNSHYVFGFDTIQLSDLTSSGSFCATSITVDDCCTFNFNWVLFNLRFILFPVLSDFSFQLTRSTKSLKE